MSSENAAPPRLWSFEPVVRRIAARYGKRVADKWRQVVVAHAGQLNLTALQTAVLHEDEAAIERLLRAGKLQKELERALVPLFAAVAQSTGQATAKIMEQHGLGFSFQATHPNIVLYAREQSAALVADIPAATRSAIREIIALGAEGRLTVLQQTHALRSVVGLPPTWAQAPQRLAEEIVQGRVAAATRRRLSAADQERIRNRVAAGTNNEVFAQAMATKYSKGLIARRAETIARTETQRAAHFGLAESWEQAVRKGVLPKTARRYWIVTPDDRLCPICRRIPGMNPRGRGLKEAFMTPEGPVMAPPAPHPNCRCTVGLMPQG